MVGVTTDNLIKLSGNKRRLIEFLLKNGEQPFYKIADYFKKIPKKEGGGISKAAVSYMVHDLNPNGLISFRANTSGEKIVILNEKALITNYVSDRFLPHIIATAIAYPVFFGVAILLSQMWFFFGSATIISCVFACISYFIFKTNKMKDYFYIKPVKVT